MKLKTGDHVRIINAKGIECNEGYFENGDTTEVAYYKYKGYLALKHDAVELEGGLVLSPSEYHCVQKI